MILFFFMEGVNFYTNSSAFMRSLRECVGVRWCLGWVVSALMAGIKADRPSCEEVMSDEV